MSRLRRSIKIVERAAAGSEERARAICAAHGNRPDELLEIFHDVQHELGYVPEPALPVIANALNRSRAEVYGVLSFYHEFRRAPAGRHVVKICRAEACQAMHTDEALPPRRGAARREVRRDERRRRVHARGRLLPRQLRAVAGHDDRRRSLRLRRHEALRRRSSPTSITEAAA